MVTREDLWALRSVLSSKKGSLSATYNKNTEADTKVYDLNQKTMLALDRLADAYSTFEETWAKMEHETVEGDVLFAMSYEAMDELAKAQQCQSRCQDELDSSLQSMDAAIRELNNCRALHDVACDELKEASQRTIELKRKADDAHDRTRSHRDRCRRATKEHVRAEEALNDDLGYLGLLVKDTANATHALSCGVPDMNGKLGKALDLIDEWQARGSRRSLEGHDDREATEMVLVVERPQQHTADVSHAKEQDMRSTECDT